MGELKAAVIGTGFIGPVHVEALQRLNVPVGGVLGSSEEKSRRAAERMGLDKGYASLEELLEDDDVDVVHITTPNDLHFEQAKAALEAGKHVLCEKPLAMNSEETAQLVRLAEASDVVAGVNYNLRFYPLCLEARERIQQGEIGEVYSICGNYVQDWLLYPDDYNWRVLAEKAGPLRAIADIGTHWLDLVQTITGLRVEALCADLQIVHPTRQRPVGEVETFKGKEEKASSTESIEVTTEDAGYVMVRFDNGARGLLWVSQITAGRKNHLQFEIAGSNQALSWCSESPNELWIGHRDRPNEELIRDPALVSESTRTFTDYPGGHNEGFPDTFKQCFRAFYDAIAKGTSPTSAPFASFSDGHHEVLLCEAILESAREERWVTVTD